MRLSFAREPWVVCGLLVLVCILVPREAASQYTPLSGNGRNVLEGHWQSCQEPRGGLYAERVYDHVVNGLGLYEVHLGPRREFAIFKDVQEPHRDHASAENLLKPYRVTMEAGRARQRWEISALGLAFTVTLGGGSRTDCENWYILLEPLDKASD